MPSLLNGLSQMGSSISAFAGTAGLDAQKEALAEQGARLADQLSHTSKTAEIAQGGAIQSGIVGQQSASAQAVATTGAQAQLGSAALQAKGYTDSATINAQGQRDVANTQANTLPPEVKGAIFLSTATPEQKAAYNQEQTARLGLPAWALAPTGTSPSDAGGGSSSSQPSGGAAGSSGNAAIPSTPAPNAQGRTVNEHALDGLPGPAAEMVKGMVEGRISPPGAYAMSRPGSIWLPLMQKALQYDPTFDETSWAGRVATRKDFTAGDSAKAITIMNTALGHADNLAGAFDTLNNNGGFGTLLNAPENWIEKQFGDANVTNAQEAVGALASEARKVFAASGGGNLTELENWEKNFPMNGSPAQQKGALQQFGNLLDSRLSSLSDQYNRGMGVTGDQVKILTPEGAAAFQHLTGREPSTGVGYQTGKPPPSGAPANRPPLSSILTLPGAGNPAPAAGMPAGSGITY